MLRVKVTLIYIALVGALVAIITLLVQMDVEELVRNDADVALRRAAVAAEQSTRLDEASLLAKAQFVASGDRLYRSLKGEFVRKAEEEGEEGEPETTEDTDFEGQRHLDAHEKLTAQKYKLDELAKAESSTRNVSRSPIARNAQEVDVFMVLDDSGTGVAALGKDLYSWFGADISKQFPVIREVADGGTARIDYWMWSFKPADEKRLYRVAIAPLRRSLAEKPSGVVVLGSMISDGLAVREQRLVAGAPEKASEEGDQPYFDYAPEVAFFRDEEIVGSTFDSSLQEAVATSLSKEGMFASDKPQLLGKVTVEETPYIVLSRQLHSGEPPVGVVVFANLEHARKPLGALRVNILLVGAIFLLVGAFALVFVVLRFVRPIENLETGLQEVIAGNKDYVWEQESGHELQTSLAQGLNLMSAFLQGKPMPDEDQAGKGWGDLMGGAPDASQSTGPSEVQGVDLSALSAPPPKSDEDEEA
jgi:hypothetical protein